MYISKKRKKSVNVSLSFLLHFNISLQCVKLITEIPLSLFSTPMCSKNKNNHEQDSNVSPDIQNKKAVKFKEIFPVYKKER